MIKSLRKKFIIINMSFVGLILLLVFVTIIYSNYNRLERNSIMSLEHVLEDNKNILMRPEINKKPFETGQPRYTRVFTISLNEDNQIISSFFENVTLSDESLQEIIEHVLNNDSDRGIILEYKLRYVLNKRNGITKIAFTDMQNEIIIMQGLVRSSIILFVFGMMAFFLISLFLSKWALNPLEKSWIQQKQFVADASHELKTPLTVILANNKILSNNSDKTIAEQKKWIESTLAEGQRMKKLIDDLLFLAKSDANTSKTVFTSVNLSDTLMSSLLPFESVAYEKGIELQSDIKDNIHVDGNEGQLKQLFAILIDNACKYTDENGLINVTLKVISSKVALVCVQNNGESISKEDLAHIFDRFYRADKARLHKEGGYGLGLSIAKSIANEHNAKIWAESSSIDGTKFYVEFRKID